MEEDLERLKQRLPLLEYLQRHNWTPQRAGLRQELLSARVSPICASNRLLPHSKGGLFAWDSVRQHSIVIQVEGLFDLAVLWQAGFRNTTCAIGTHLTPAQLAQLCDAPGRSVYIVFDQDENHAGQQASRLLAQRLQSAGIRAHMVHLPPGHDPNSYFVASATATDLVACLQHAQHL